MNAAYRATFVSPVDLLQAAIDALEHNPDEQPIADGHPQDAYAEARGALDIVAGAAIARTTRARD